MAFTYTAIATGTVTGSPFNIIFSSIPQTYTDLLIKISSRTTRTANVYDNLRLFINTTDANLSSRYLLSTGTAIASNVIGGNGFLVSAPATNGATANFYGNAEIYIPNYTTASAREIMYYGCADNRGTEARTGQTAISYTGSVAVTEIQLQGDNNVMVATSTATLYGIKKD